MTENKGLRWIFDAALLGSLTFGILYLSGYVFHESMLSALGIPPRSTVMSVETVTVYGSTQILMSVLVVAACLIVGGALGPLVRSYIQSKLKGKLEPDKSVTSAAESTGIILGIFVIGVLLTVLYSGSKGKEVAAGISEGKCHVMDISYAGDKEFVGCFAAEAVDGKWFVEMDACTRKRVRAIYLPLGDIKMMSSSPPPDPVTCQKAANAK